MTEELKGRRFPLDRKDIKIKKLEKKLAFYKIYATKLEARLKRCEEKVKETQPNEGGNTE
jgi:hypothetical protein|tara:strand:+ start:13970 stop:14149 length:180 start_codon:yes stop_codon:yes gene_type:complete